MQSSFEAAGLHPDVDFLVRGTRWDGPTLSVEAEIRYHAASRICCAEPVCYIPALRPQGLRVIADTIRREELLDAEPKLRVMLTLVIEPGFRFLEADLAAKDGSVQTYQHPEDQKA